MQEPGFAQPNYPQMSQAESAPFEPDDPIPAEKPTEPAPVPDKKHRPKFVDFFIRKNSDK